MENNEVEIDFTTILSGEMISEIVEIYFNQELYKKQVKVVDCKASGDAYVFGLQFVHEQTVVRERREAEVYDSLPKESVKAVISNAMLALDEQQPRKNGRFVKKG